MKVFRWGDDLAVELPNELVEALGLKEGDVLEIAARRPQRVKSEDNKKANEFPNESDE